MKKNTQALQDWLTRSNDEALYHLERQGRTCLGVVPFLGAGLSTAFNFKDWKHLLLDASPPRVAQRVKRQLDANDYEGAAETLLKALGPDSFQNMVAASAGDSKLDSFNFRTGTVSLLPLLSNGPVITTNFDRVLERAFEVNGYPFESVISGPRPDLIVDALHGNRRVLIKLHGDWQDRVGRTFAKSDYDANYGKAQPERKRMLLAGVEGLLFSSRSLLFIGASLGPDRTVRLLQEVHQRYAGVRHFAIMSVPKTQAAFEKKERHLRSCGVLPLWYHAENAQQHVEQVEKLVAGIVERISVRTLAPPAAPKLTRSRFKAQPVPASLPPLPDLDGHFDRVARLIEDGRLIFFLGSAIHFPTRLMAAEFYDELARVFECEALKVERFAVAQYIADRHGRDNLYGEIHKLFARTRLIPRETHELFASWKKFRTHAGGPLPFPMVFTTNHDNVLESCLRQAGLPFHLLCYQADGPHRGLFYHQAPDSALRLIEQPQKIREFSDAFIVIKLNGSIDPAGRIPESYATTRLDFWDLAARLPGVLPATIQEKLCAKPLLFLGHGLAAPDVESLVRFAHRNHPGPRSWAVVLKKSGIEYWKQCGVEILNLPVDVYVNHLRNRLARNSGPPLALRAPQRGSGQRSKP